MLKRIPVVGTGVEKGLFLYKLRKYYTGKNSKWGKLLILLAILYVFFPLDLIPDFFIGPGFIDDLLIIFSLVTALIVEYKNYQNSKTPKI